jgi:hypothetical protein
VLLLIRRDRAFQRFPRNQIMLGLSEDQFKILNSGWAAMKRTAIIDPGVTVIALCSGNGLMTQFHNFAPYYGSAYHD